MGDRRPMFVTREGIEVPLPGREQLQTLRDGGDDRWSPCSSGSTPPGSGRLWLTWRHGGAFGQADPILGRRRRLLRLLAALLAVASAASARCSSSLAALVAGGVVSRVRQPRRRASGSRLSMTPRRAAPPVVARRGVLRCCWPRARGCSRAEHLLEPTALIFGASYADVIGPHAGRPAAGRGVRRRRRAGRRAGVHAAQLADSGGRRPLPRWCRSAARSTAACCSASSSRPTSRRARRPYIQHNIDATRRAFALDARRGARAVRRRAADARRHRPQRGDARERAAVGPPAAARDVRPDPGDPHLLRLRLGGQRPLPRQRRAAAGDAVGARAQLGEPAEPHLGQRAPHVHARLRPDARSGQPGDRRRACRCCSCAICRR